MRNAKCLVAIIVVALALGVSPALAITSNENVLIPEVVAFYTPTRLAAVGSEEQLFLIAQRQVELFNLAAKNSEVAAQVRLIALAPIDYVESASESSRSLLERFTADARVHQSRDLAGADIAILLTQEPRGIAWIGGFYAPDSAFAIAGPPEYGETVLAHEVAHVFGLLHDREHAAPVDPAYADGYGWPYRVGNQWRLDIMSSLEVCRDAGALSNCVSRLQFSNPLVMDEGVPTGKPEEAEGALVLERNLAMVASYRLSRTESFGQTFSRYRTASRAFNTKVTLSGNSGFVRLYRGQSKLGRCQGQPFATVPLTNGVAIAALTGWSKAPAYTCAETELGGVKAWRVTTLP